MVSVTIRLTVDTGGAASGAGCAGWSFADLRHVGSDELELVIDERHLARVAGCPGAALLHAQIAASHGSDPLVRLDSGQAQTNPNSERMHIPRRWHRFLAEPNLQMTIPRR